MQHNKIIYNLTKNTKEVMRTELTPEELEKIQKEEAKAERDYWRNIDLGEAVNSKIREKYSESQEFSILRQKDEKPEEYAEYFFYCEQCKDFVKRKKGLK